METIFIFEFNRSYTRNQLLKAIAEYDSTTVFCTKSLSLQELAEMLVDLDEEEYGY